MKKMQKISFLFALNLAICANVFASNANISITGSIPAFVPNNKVEKAEGPRTAMTAKTGHYVMLQRIILSENASTYLKKRIHNVGKLHFNSSAKDLPTRVDLGMNDVPVLDQGYHGTCVTFALTGALDAAIGHTDYISQLCNLSLGKYLSDQGEIPYSGWDGAWNIDVLGQVQKYGIISMTYQRENGCGSPGELVKEYPVNDFSTGSPMSVDDFALHSEKIMPPVSWNSLLNKDDAMTPREDMVKIFADVKQALANGHRVVFGVLLDVYVGINGAEGSYKTANDSWILTDQIKQDFENDDIHAGHDLIITGYDDNASITGPNGDVHQGVLTLRNSWGADAGNGGEYYMSYDHFQTLALEVEEIVPTQAK